MNIGEFKAWLAGYLESCSASPAKRVKRIEEQLAEVRESPAISNPVYVDRYVYPYTRPRFDWITTDGIGLKDAIWTVSNDTITCNDATGNTTTTVAYLNSGGE